ncbi:MAG: hypothetical protein IT204_19165 [Fimbriimonadaceae bacterium]|nr:hypothetical protein [Fimbriimonadaceae bacterium]
MRWYHGWLAALLLGPAEGAGVDLTPWNESPRSGAQYAGQLRRSCDARFGGLAVPYAVRYNRTINPADPSFGDVGEGPVGLPSPSTENWYGGGFIETRLAGQRLDTGPLSSIAVVEDGPRGILDLVWHGDFGSLRYRFVGVDGSDHLALQIDLQPRQPGGAVDVLLRAYPSYFTSWHQRDGARRMRTAAGTVAQGQEQTWPGAAAAWCVLYDEVFDVARGEGEGPCAVAWQPSAVATARLVAEAYPCSLNLSLTPGTTRLRLALWEFPGQPNASVLKTFAKRATQAMAAIEAADCTPRSLQGADPAALRTVAAAVAARPALAQAQAARLALLQQWLQAAGSGPTTARDIAAEERLLATWQATETAWWELKLALLLAD